MITRKTLLAGALIASFAGFSPPSYSQDMYINVDPPSRRAEKFEQRPGHVWAPGVWEWRNGKHEWTAGHYLPERKGYRWEPDRWVRHDNEKWTMQRGGWSRDEGQHGEHHSNNDHR